VRKFARKWIRLLRALWIVANTETPAAPVSSQFDFENESLLHELMKDHHFERMLRAISEAETARQVEMMRMYVRQQKLFEAGMTEASIEVFEDLPHAFRRLANLYQGDRERA